MRVVDVFELKCRVEDCASAELLSNEAYDDLPLFDGQLLAHGWVPPAARFSAGPVGTFSYLTAGAMMCDRGSAATLVESVNGEVELLPIRIGDQEYAVVNVVAVVDALDEERSEIKRFSSGRVQRVVRYSFRAEMLDGLRLFRVPQLTTIVFATGSFMDIAAEHKWDGLEYELLYSVQLPRVREHQ